MPTSQRYRLEPGAGMLTLSLPPVKHWQNILFCAAELLICLISSVKVLPYYLHTIQTFGANNGLFNLIWLLIWCLICFAALRRAAWLFFGAQVLPARPGELGFQRRLFGLPRSALGAAIPTPASNVGIMTPKHRQTISERRRLWSNGSRP